MAVNNSGQAYGNSKNSSGMMVAGGGGMGSGFNVHDYYMKKMADELAELKSRPDRPEFLSVRGDDDLLKDQFRLQNTLNTGFLDRMRQEGLRGPGEASPWRTLQQAQLEREAGNVAQRINQQNALAQDQMAMRGGLRAGAAERMANNSVRQNLAAQQDILGRGLQLDMADEQNRLGSLGRLGQAEMGAAQFQQNTDRFNIQAALNDVFQERAADMNAYNEQMRAWASERTAASTPSGGGGKK